MPALEAEHVARVANRMEVTGRVDEALAVLGEDLSDAHAHSTAVGYLEPTPLV